MKHTATVIIPKEEQDRINKLLAIPSISELTDEQLDAMGAYTDMCYGVFYVDFDDGSSLNYDLCAGSENFYDDIVWFSPDGNRDVTLECTFEFDNDIGFEVDGEEYEVKIVEG